MSNRQDQSRTMRWLFRAAWALVGLLGVLTLRDAYNVIWQGASLESVNNSLAAFVIGLTLVLMVKVVLVQNEVLSQ